MQPGKLVVIDVPCLNDPVASRGQKLHRLVLELVRRREQTYLDWLQDTIDLLHCRTDLRSNSVHSGGDADRARPSTLDRFWRVATFDQRFEQIQL